MPVLTVPAGERPDVAALAAAAERDEAVQLWVEQVEPEDDAALAEIGFVPYRDLWQLRRPLPAPGTPLPTRAFVPGRDDADVLRVNNRAFDWHPEQGGLTLDDLDRRMAEPWFDAKGFRLFERDGQLAGFCWTKVHSDADPPLGEIYVIAIDPDYHGLGLGGPMTLAGLAHLADRGLTVAMLYVESDNEPAVATYARLGFTHHSTNRAYRIHAPQR